MSLRCLLPWVIAAALVLPGCAELSVTLGLGDREQAVDRLVEQREYGRALALIDDIPERDPRREYFQYRREQIVQLAREFELERFTTAGELQQTGNWEAALAVYTDALDRYPDGQLLREGLDYLRGEQAKRAAELEFEILVSRGAYLVEALPPQRKLTEVNPEDKAARALLDDLEAEALEVGAILAERGAEALESGDHSLARRLLPLAHRLNPGPEVTARYQALKALERSEKSKVRTQAKRAEAKKRRQAAAHERQRSRNLYAAYEEAAEQGDLARARALLREIVRIEGEDSPAAGLLFETEMRIEQEVKTLAERGSSAYSRGQFEQAVVLWNQALALEPGNEKVQANLKRAERVLARLKELREKQQGQAADAASPAPP